MNLISKEGFEKAKEELKYLLYEKHIKITQDISSARALGDLSENAEYQAAREDQRELIRRVKYLTEIVEQSQVINLEDVNTSKIQFGTTFSIKDLETEKTKTYTILSEYESNIEKGIINYKSPLAKTFMNLEIGDSKEFNKIEYEVISIKKFVY